MRRFGYLSLALCLAMVAFTTVSSQERPGKTPLDLPVGGSGSGEDEEDAPEVISFYGLEIEGDSFNFCFAAYAW